MATPTPKASIKLSESGTFLLTPVIDEETWSAHWYREKARSDVIYSALEDQPDGHFLVHDDPTSDSRFFLSYRFAGETLSVAIECLLDRVHLANSAVYFPYLSHLVEHYSNSRQKDLKHHLVLHDPVLPPPARAALPEHVASWTVADVCSWLSQSGMDHFVQTFKDNQIDGHALLLCDSQTLKELGVMALGPRTKIVNFIQQSKQASPPQSHGSRYLTKSNPAMIYSSSTMRPATGAGTYQKSQLYVNDSPAASPFPSSKGLSWRPPAQSAPPRPKTKPPSLQSRLDHSALSALYWLGPTTATEATMSLQAFDEGSFAIHMPQTGSVPTSLILHYVQAHQCKSIKIENAPSGLHLTGQSEFFETLSQLVDNLTSPSSVLGVVLSHAANMRSLLIFQRQPSIPVITNSTLDRRLTLKPQPAHSTQEISSLASFWYFESLSPPQIRAILDLEPVGSFIITRSLLDDGTYDLWYTGREGVLQCDITRSMQSFSLSSSQLKFDSLLELVQFYSQQRTLELACLLRIPTKPYNIRAKDSTLPSAATLERTASSNVPWFFDQQSGISATSLLKSQPSGSFLIRATDTPTTFVLAFVNRGVVLQEFIQTTTSATHTGVCLERSPHVTFSSLQELIDHYSVNTAEFGCELKPVSFGAKQVFSSTLRSAKPSRLDLTRRLRRESLAPAAPKCYLWHESSSTDVDSGLPTEVLMRTASERKVPESDKRKSESSRPSSTTATIASDVATDVDLMPERLSVQSALSSHSVDSTTRWVEDSHPVPPHPARLAKRNATAPILKPVRALSIRQHSAPTVLSRLSQEYPVRPAAGWQWYQIGVPAADALAHLTNEPDGTFVLRSSETTSDRFILSYKFLKAIRHEVVCAPSGDLSRPGVCLQKAPHLQFDNLHELLAYFQLPRDELACSLLNPNSSGFGRSSSRLSEIASEGRSHRTSMTLHGNPFLDQRALRAPWNGFGLSRDECMEKLKDAPDGSFVVRESEGHFGLLTMVASGRFHQFTILQTEQGVHLRESDVFHASLSALVDYYSWNSTAELPCTLCKPP
eukprot:m.119109 g.119109  ORF g.119109 m.119109 type:complete len:1049 (+) comp52040_c0_seq1:290-3436(+)